MEKNCIWFLWKNFPLDHADCFSCKNQNYWYLALGSAEILIFSGSAAITYYCWLVLKSILPNHLQVEKSHDIMRIMIIATRYNTSCIHNILFSKKLQSHISSDITIPRSGAFPKMISQGFTGAMQTDST